MPVREPESWVRRTGKGLLCASASLLLGVVGHVTAGGRLPGTGALLVVLCVLTILATALFGSRRRRFDVTVLVFGGLQFTLHIALHLLSAGHAPDTHTARHPVVPLGPTGDAAMTSDRAHSAAGETLTAAETTAQSITMAMTAGHALATLGSAFCLVFGERLLRRLAALVCTGLRRPARPALPPLPDSRPPAFTSVTYHCVAPMLTRCRPRRGPPLLRPA